PSTEGDGDGGGGDRGPSDPSPASSRPSRRARRLHDLLALGEVESALRSGSSPSSEGSPRGGGEGPPSSGAGTDGGGGEGGKGDGGGDGRDDDDDDGGGGGGSDPLSLRLPLLLRHLSAATRPRAQAGAGGLLASNANGAAATIALLEDVATIRPDAEGVEALVASAVPRLCEEVCGGLEAPRRKRRGGRLSARSRRRGGAGGGTFEERDARSLDAALYRLDDPAKAKASRKRRAEGEEPPPKRPKRADDDGDDDDPTMEKMQMVIDLLERGGNDEKGGAAGGGEEELVEDDGASPSASSAAAAARAFDDDSRESSARRTLRELLVLVRSSLATSAGAADAAGGAAGGGDGDEDDDDEGHPAASSHPKKPHRFLAETGFEAPALALKPDWILAEAEEGTSSRGGGGRSSRPVVVVPALMQHATILRHDHVANALCRAMAPQAPSLIEAMAANCPAASQSLLRGCIAAHRLAKKFESLASDAADADGSSDLSDAKSIVETSLEATRRLMALSRREALGAVRALRDERVMDGLVLSALMEHDPVGAASFVVEKLTSPPEVVATGPATAKQDSDGGRARSSDEERPKPTLRERTNLGRPGDASGAIPVPSRFREELVRDGSLAENALRFLCRRICSLREEGDKTNESLGEATLFVRAFAVLMHSIGTGEGASMQSGSEIVEDAVIAMGQLSIDNEPGRDLPTRSSKDNIFKTATCATIVACGAIAHEETAKARIGCLQGLLQRPSSVESIVFSSRLAGFIISNDSTSLGRVVFEIISSREGNFDPDQMTRLECLVQNMSSNSEKGRLKSIHDKGLTVNSIVHDPIVAVEAMGQSSSQPANELDDLMKTIFADPDICAKIIQHPHAPALVGESVKMLLSRPAPHIPLVLPLSLERLSHSLPWDELNIDKGMACKLLSLFVFQLLYALDFLNQQPHSPFVINPRLFPLKDTLAYLDSHNKSGNGQKSKGFKKMSSALKALLSKHCPDILLALEDDAHFHQENDAPVLNRSLDIVVKPSMVCEAIRDCLNNNAIDSSGLRAEQMFMLCRSVYPCLEVDVAAVGAMLASNKSQPKFYSYVALAKDPLVLLKARARVWKCRGIRCILLLILRDLMNANECMAIQTSETESVASEYLTARDTIIVRCIVFACASGFVFGECDASKILHSRHCMISVNMIRSVISKQRGVVAALIKQDLPENCIDWMVEFVPECLLDAPIIASLLAEKGLLTASERLSAASSALQIAVAHSSRGEAVAKSLISAATAVLLDSFALAIGPIGVPVSILREESGRDVTNVCREKMFRMINTLSRISPLSTDMRNEASITLSKIAALCKNENAVGGVSGIAASRRKAILKEIWECCVQANTALGGAMQM
ncbi:hypothetical protein ACHAWF_007043, partial [Thalassiosira exigua]